jgi:small-conductance mechanosensitive channel
MMNLKTTASVLKLKQKASLLILFGFLYIVFPSYLTGQSVAVADPELAGIQKNMSPVKIDGHQLFYVSGISSYPASQRATNIVKRIIKAAENPLISPDSVKIISNDDMIQIFAGSEFIMTIHNIDAENEGVSRKILAGVIQSKTKETIENYRQNRSRPILIKKMVFGIAALALMTIVVLFYLWLTRLIESGIKKRLKSRVENLEDKSYKLIRSEQFWKIFNLGFRTLRILLLVILVIAFIEYILGLFPWTNSIAVSVLELIVNPIKSIGNGIINYLPSLVFLVIILLITRYLLKLIKLLFAGIGKGAIVVKNFYPDWAMPTFKILRIFIVAFAVVIAYPYIPGSGSVAFKGVSVFLGVLVSFGSSSFIGNIIAGYSMTYRRAFKNGDRIEVDGKIGFVEEQKMLVTRLRSHKNEEIIIPNSVLMNSHIINYSTKEAEKGVILHTSVGIGYETPWRLVDAMLMMAADKTEGILKEPAPFVLKTSLGDYAVNYEINAYCRDVPEILKHYNDLHQNILDVFNENNVQIMTPSYVLDPEIPKVIPKDQWDTKLTNDNDKSKS